MAERDRERAEENENNSKKKIVEYAEADAEKRRNFLEELKEVPLEDRVFLDESGVDLSDFRRHGRAERGKKVVVKESGKRGVRFNVIAAIFGKKLDAKFIFKGATNTFIFNRWLEHVLVPLLRRGMTIIMDNASFHKSGRTKEIIEEAGCKLLFLPPYSPDMNPIENEWHPVKSTFRKLKRNGKEGVPALREALNMEFGY